MHNLELIALLEEVLEHTIDSDANRFQHFYLYDKNKSNQKCLRFFQFICLAIIVFAALVDTELRFKLSDSWIIILLGIVASFLELLSMYFNYDESANQHFKAAQSFSRLYRECQFFYTNYSSLSIDLLREKVNTITVELNTLNLMSPDLSLKSYRAYEQQFLVVKKSWCLKCMIKLNQLGELLIISMPFGLKRRKKEIRLKYLSANCQTPIIDEKTYLTIEEYLILKSDYESIITDKIRNKKSYPIEKIIKDLKLINIDDNIITSTINKFLGGYEYVLIHFGSSLGNSEQAKDLDLAIILDSKVQIDEKLLKAKAELLRLALKIDISVITPDYFDLPQYYIFLKNVQQGKILFRTENFSQRVLDNHKLSLYDYGQFINKCYIDLTFCPCEAELMKCYKYLYHVIALLILNQKESITWNSTADMKLIFYTIVKNDRTELIYNNFEILGHFLDTSLFLKDDTIQYNEIFQNIKDIHSWILKNYPGMMSKINNV